MAAPAVAAGAALVVCEATPVPEDTGTVTEVRTRLEVGTTTTGVEEVTTITEETCWLAPAEVVAAATGKLQLDATSKMSKVCQ
jgi:hypothetical protein